MRVRSSSHHERGQGLVEYALVLVLAAVAVVGVAAQLGPGVGNVFSSIATQLQPSAAGAVTSVAAARTGNGHGNALVVTFTVSVSTTVTVSDSQNASPVSNVPCSGTCQVTLGGVGFNAGTVTVTDAGGGTATADYPAKLHP